MVVTQVGAVLIHLLEESLTIVVPNLDWVPHADVPHLIEQRAFWHKVPQNPVLWITLWRGLLLLLNALDGPCTQNCEQDRGVLHAEEI